MITLMGDLDREMDKERVTLLLDLSATLEIVLTVVSERTVLP